MTHYIATTSEKLRNMDPETFGEKHRTGVEESIGRNLYESFCVEKDRIPFDDWICMWSNSRTFDQKDDELAFMVGVYLEPIDPKEDM